MRHGTARLDATHTHEYPPTYTAHGYYQVKSDLPVQTTTHDSGQRVLYAICLATYRKHEYQGNTKNQVQPLLAFKTSPFSHGGVSINV